MGPGRETSGGGCQGLAEEGEPLRKAAQPLRHQQGGRGIRKGWD